jgi:hypothetical protein
VFRLRDPAIAVHDLHTSFSEEIMDRMLGQTRPASGTPGATATEHHLIEEWRRKSDEHREFGNPGAARAFQEAADQLEARLQEHRDELLTLGEASGACVLTADHLGRMIREGRLPNHGRKGAPRIRRSDLPAHGGAPATRVAGSDGPGDTVGRLFRDIASKKRG